MDVISAMRSEGRAEYTGPITAAPEVFHTITTGWAARASPARYPVITPIRTSMLHFTIQMWESMSAQAAAMHQAATPNQAREEGGEDEELQSGYTSLTRRKPRLSLPIQ